MENKMNYLLLSYDTQNFYTDPSLGCAWKGTTFELKRDIENFITLHFKTQTKDPNEEDTEIANLSIHVMKIIEESDK